MSLLKALCSPFLTAHQSTSHRHSTDTYSGRCSYYIAASDINKPNTEFCTDFTKMQAHGVVGER